MPRKQGGIGRTGGKHKKPSTHDLHRQPKAEIDRSGAGGPDTSHAAESADLPSEAGGTASTAACAALGTAGWPEGGRHRVAKRSVQRRRHTPTTPASMEKLS